MLGNVAHSCCWNRANVYEQYVVDSMTCSASRYSVPATESICACFAALYASVHGCMTILLKWRSGHGICCSSCQLHIPLVSDRVRFSTSGTVATTASEARSAEHQPAFRYLAGASLCLCPTPASTCAGLGRSYCLRATLSLAANTRQAARVGFVAGR